SAGRSARTVAPVTASSPCPPRASCRRLPVSPRPAGAGQRVGGPTEAVADRGPAGHGRGPTRPSVSAVPPVRHPYQSPFSPGATCRHRAVCRVHPHEDEGRSRWWVRPPYGTLEVKGSPASPYPRSEARTTTSSGGHAPLRRPGLGGRPFSLRPASRDRRPAVLRGGDRVSSACHRVGKEETCPSPMTSASSISRPASSRRTPASPAPCPTD